MNKFTLPLKGFWQQFYCMLLDYSFYLIFCHFQYRWVFGPAETEIPLKANMVLPLDRVTENMHWGLRCAKAKGRCG